MKIGKVIIEDNDILNIEVVMPYKNYQTREEQEKLIYEYYYNKLCSDKDKKYINDIALNVITVDRVIPIYVKIERSKVDTLEDLLLEIYKRSN